MNHLCAYGRWAFAELRDMYLIEAELEERIAEAIASAVSSGGEAAR